MQRFTQQRFTQQRIMMAITGVLALLAALLSGTPATARVGSTSSTSAASDWVESTLADMTLEEKVGQLFMTYAYGQTADTQDTPRRSPSRS